jgi:hypothetical protein
MTYSLEKIREYIYHRSGEILHYFENEACEGHSFDMCVWDKNNERVICSFSYVDHNSSDVWFGDLEYDISEKTIRAEAMVHKYYTDFTPPPSEEILTMFFS